MTNSQYINWSAIIMKKFYVFIISLLTFVNLYSEESVSPKQIIKGEILNLQTQQKVIGAKIILEGTKLGAVSDSKGEFRIKNVPIGRYTAKISSVGYEPTTQNIVLTSGKEYIMNIQLNESYQTTDEIVVTGSKGVFESINESAIVSSTVFSIDDVDRYAGSRGDPGRIAQNFAGVISANDQRNDIIIRGGSPVELLWRMDGLDIPNPNHFATQGATGGPISAINARFLDNSDFLTGAFPSEYGDKLSGAFDLKTRRGNKEKYEFMGQFGFNGLEVGAEGPANKDASFIANYRYSFLDLLVAMGIDFGFAGVPKYQDANFKYDWDIDANNKIYVTGLFATSDIYVENSKQKEVYTGDIDIKNGTDLISIGLNYQHIFSNQLYGKLLIGTSYSRYRTILDSITTDKNGAFLNTYLWTTDKSSEAYHTAKYTLNYTINSKSFITSGVEARYKYYYLLEERNTVSRNSTTGIPYKLDINGNSMQYMGFVNWNWRITEDITLNSGLFTQYLELSGKSTLEPRLAASWKLGSGQSLNLGFGMHSQSLPLQMYFAQVGNKDLDFMKSTHYVIGYNNQIAKNSILKIEAYYKDLSYVPIESNKLTSWSLLNSGTSYGSVDVRDINAVSKGIGNAYGAELTFMKHFTDGWYMTSTASYVRQQYKGSDDVLRWGAFDNKFIFNILAGYEIKMSETFTIEMSGKFVVAGGSPYTAIDLTESKKTGITSYDTKNAFAMRNDTYSKFDFRVDFRQNLEGVSIISYFSIENILNRTNVLQYVYDFKNDKTKALNQLGFFPIGGVRVEF